MFRRPTLFLSFWASLPRFAQMLAFFVCPVVLFSFRHSPYSPRPPKTNSSQYYLPLSFCREGAQLLDEVQKGLSDYLETKRSVFARLYFLSNDELLSILSESKDVHRVQPHLKKCFEGIDKVRAYTVLESIHDSQVTSETADHTMRDCACCNQFRGGPILQIHIRHFIKP